MALHRSNHHTVHWKYTQFYSSNICLSGTAEMTDFKTYIDDGNKAMFQRKEVMELQGARAVAWYPLHSDLADFPVDIYQKSRRHLRSIISLLEMLFTLKYSRVLYIF